MGLHITIVRNQLLWLQLALFIDFNRSVDSVAAVTVAKAAIPALCYHKIMRFEKC